MKRNLENEPELDSDKKPRLMISYSNIKYSLQDINFDIIRKILIEHCNPYTFWLIMFVSKHFNNVYKDIIIHLPNLTCSDSKNPIRYYLPTSQNFNFEMLYYQFSKEQEEIDKLTKPNHNTKIKKPKLVREIFRNQHEISRSSLKKRKLSENYLNICREFISRGFDMAKTNNIDFALEFGFLDLLKVYRNKFYKRKQITSNSPTDDENPDNYDQLTIWDITLAFKHGHYKIIEFLIHYDKTVELLNGVDFVNLIKSNNTETVKMVIRDLVTNPRKDIPTTAKMQKFFIDRFTRKNILRAAMDAKIKDENSEPEMLKVVVDYLITHQKMDISYIVRILMDELLVFGPKNTMKIIRFIQQDLGYGDALNGNGEDPNTRFLLRHRVWSHGKLGDSKVLEILKFAYHDLDGSKTDFFKPHDLALPIKRGLVFTFEWLLNQTHFNTAPSNAEVVKECIYWIGWGFQGVCLPNILSISSLITKKIKAENLTHLTQEYDSEQKLILAKRYLFLD